MKVGATRVGFDPYAALGFISSGGFAATFLAGGQHWAIIGAGVAAVAGLLRVSLKLSQVAAQSGADAPARSLKVEAAGDSVPVVNGDGKAVAKVATLPPDAPDHLAEANAQQAALDAMKAPAIGGLGASRPAS